MNSKNIPPLPSLKFLQSPRDSYQQLIAIPCCNENENLPSVISSLELNDQNLLDQTLIVINVNNRTSASPQNNIETINWLKSLKTPLHISFLDASSPPYSYPEKFGVGLARAQAIHAAISLIPDTAPVISLDADSPVSNNYLSEIFHFIKMNPNFGAGHVNFQHQLVGSADEIKAIKLYDKHLHLHREGLANAGSPHAWYAIGSTIVCTKKAYLKAGGYNPKKMAGEDFYLLQQLSKVGYKIEFIQNAFVFPSNRQSDRVPFGTGKAVSDIVSSGEWLTYNPLCYKVLHDFLKIIYTHLDDNAANILSKIPAELINWLNERDFTAIWQKLRQNNKSNEKMKQSFDSWLDAFQTLKLIHFLTEHYFPKVNITL